MMENNILKYCMKIIRIFLYIIIILLTIILIYSKLSTPKSDFYLNEFLNKFHKIPKDAPETVE